jgi:hypothetical protein
MIVLAGIVIVQQGYIFLSERRHERVQKDLLNRLMVKDTNEYVQVTAGKKQDQGIRNPIQRNIQEDLKKQGIIK